MSTLARRDRVHLGWKLAILAIAAPVVCACGGDTSTGSGAALDRVAPPAPTGIKVDKIRDGEVWLSWDPVSDDREGPVRYCVYRAAAGGNPASVDTTYHTSFQDFGLEYETEYTYHVTAIDAAGNEGPPSAQIAGQPLNNLAPLAPTGLRAFAHNLALFAGQTVDISLDWDANVETDLAAYRLYRGSAPGFPVGPSSLRAQTLAPRFVDEDVQVGRTYYYRATAIDRGGKESPLSAEVSDVPLPLAVLLEPVRGAFTSATPTFRWMRVEGAVAYQVIVTTSPTSGEISAVAVTADTVAAFRGRPVSAGATYQLASGQLYYWKVVASTRANGQENSVTGVESFKVR